MHADLHLYVLLVLFRWHGAPHLDRRHDTDQRDQLLITCTMDKITQAAPQASVLY